MKNKTTALILSVLLGGLGIDRFYLGYMGMGVLKLLTGGVFGVLWIVDIVNIACGNLKPADGSPYEEDVKKQTQPNYYAQSYAQPAPQAEPDRFAELEKLAELHNKGVLSDEEYAGLKAECLGKMH